MLFCIARAIHPQELHPILGRGRVSLRVIYIFFFLSLVFSLSHGFFCELNFPKESQITQSVMRKQRSKQRASDAQAKRRVSNAQAKLKCCFNACCLLHSILSFCFVSFSLALYSLIISIIIIIIVFIVISSPPSPLSLLYLHSWNHFFARYIMLAFKFCRRAESHRYHLKFQAKRVRQSFVLYIVFDIDCKFKIGGGDAGLGGYKVKLFFTVYIIIKYCDLCRN